MENKFHIVDFKTYCPKCKHYSKEERMDPCNECLVFGGNIHTSVPVKFESRSKGGRKRAKRTGNSCS